MFLYFFILRIAALFNSKAKKLVQGQAKSIDTLRERIKEGDNYVWFHASSVGEFEQGRPIIERLKVEHPEQKVLLTFFSPSGYEMRKDYKGADVIVYLPFATRRNARRLLDIVKPKKVFFIKYEFWPAYLKELKKRDIPTYSIASIFNKKQFFFRPLIGKPYLNLLRNFTLLLVQDEESKTLLGKYKIHNVEVVGDPRFNRVLQIANSPKQIPALEVFRKFGEQVIVAGSTWQPDEQLLFKYIMQYSQTRLVLVPHEIDANHLHFIMQLFSGRFAKYTDLQKLNYNQLCTALQPIQVIVMDTMGLLSSAYHYADVGYVGGGFGVGIHNTLEAAAHEIPVVWGKNYKRFREAHGLIAAGGGFSIKNYKQLEQTLNYALEHHQQLGKLAKNYVLSEQDAADKIYNYCFTQN